MSSTESVKLNSKSSSTAEIEDVFCLPQSPKKVPFEEVQKASAVLKQCIAATPCTVNYWFQEPNRPFDFTAAKNLPLQKSKSSPDFFGMTVFYKKEFLQYTGSFKERGARYALSMLNDEQKRKGVVAASLGNHSQGMSYHSKQLNIPCTVVMPDTAPYNKIQKCRKFGANVIIQVRLGRDFRCFWFRLTSTVTSTGKGCRWSETLCHVAGEREGTDIHQRLRSSAHYCRSGNGSRRDIGTDWRYRCYCCAGRRRFVSNECVTILRILKLRFRFRWTHSRNSSRSESASQRHQNYRKWMSACLSGRGCDFR